MLLLLWMFVVYGIADVVAKARIGAPLRRRFPIRAKDWPVADGQAVTFAHLIRCPKCLGWWIAGALTLLHLGPAEALPAVGGEVTTLLVRAGLNAFAGSAWCWMLHVVLCKLGAEEL
jgi:hypothetical protein